MRDPSQVRQSSSVRQAACPTGRPCREAPCNGASAKGARCGRAPGPRRWSRCDALKVRRAEAPAGSPEAAHAHGASIQGSLAREDSHGPQPCIPRISTRVVGGAGPRNRRITAISFHRAHDPREHPEPDARRAIGAPAFAGPPTRARARRPPTARGRRRDPVRTRPPRGDQPAGVVAGRGRAGDPVHRNARAFRCRHRGRSAPLLRDTPANDRLAQTFHARRPVPRRPGRRPRGPDDRQATMVGSRPSLGRIDRSDVLIRAHSRRGRLPD